MYKTAIDELKNQIRILDQKLPSVEESIKTYAQMTKNYEKERDDMICRIAEYNRAIDCLEKRGDNND